MFDQVKILFKSITGEKNTLKAIWKLIYTAIGYVSSFMQQQVLLKNLSGTLQIGKTQIDYQLQTK